MQTSSSPTFVELCNELYFLSAQQPSCALFLVWVLRRRNLRRIKNSSGSPAWETTPVPQKSGMEEEVLWGCSYETCHHSSALRDNKARWQRIYLAEMDRHLTNNLFIFYSNVRKPTIPGFQKHGQKQHNMLVFHNKTRLTQTRFNQTQYYIFLIPLTWSFLKCALSTFICGHGLQLFYIKSFWIFINNCNPVVSTVK